MDTKPISSAATSAAPMPPSSAVAGMGASGTMLGEGINSKQNNNIHNNSNLGTTTSSAGGSINPIQSSSVLAPSTAPTVAVAASSSSLSTVPMEAGKNSISIGVYMDERCDKALSLSNYPLLLPFKT